MTTSHPWTKFYWGDWRSEPTLRMCSLAARGLWIEMLTVMHEAKPRGSLVVNGKSVSVEQLASLVSSSPKEVSVLLTELENLGVFSRKKNGVIFSRRMEKEEAKSAKAAANGAKGGNPVLTKDRESEENSSRIIGELSEKKERSDKVEGENDKVISGGNNTIKEQSLNPNVKPTDNHEVKPYMLEARGYMLEARKEGEGKKPLPRAFEVWEKALWAIPGVSDSALHQSAMGSMVMLMNEGFDLHAEVAPVVAADVANAIAKRRLNKLSWGTIANRVREGRASNPIRTTTPIAESTRDDWESRMRFGRRNKAWPREWNAMPNQPGCLVPPDLVQPDDGKGWTEWKAAS